jgi:pimeloyl-ACP methyl ester carboxylesterase
MTIKIRNFVSSLKRKNMEKITSKDGTTITYDKYGKGPIVIVVDGALCSRSFGPSKSLSELLASKFTVYTYDRRGRGDSNDTKPYAIEREIEDLDALIKKAGGSVYLYGSSSGGALAIEACSRLNGIHKLAVYEAPYFVDNSRTPLPEGYLARMNEAIKEDRRGDAVKMFMRLVQVPAIFIALMRIMPVWPKLKAVAHTLSYDITIMSENLHGKPLKAEHWKSIGIPALVMYGSKAAQWMQNAAQATAKNLPNAKLRMLEGQRHDVKSNILAPVLTEFFTN